MTEVFDVVLVTLFFLILTVFLVSGFLLVLRSFFGWRAAINASLAMDVEVVRVAASQKRPGEENQQQNPEQWKVEIAAMEQLIASFAALKRKLPLFRRLWGHFLYDPPTIVLELANPSDSEEIFFFAIVPKVFRETVEKQIHSFFQGAVVEKVPDYTIFRPGSATATATFKLKNIPSLPIRTYHGLSVDPLNEISTAMSRLETEAEGAAFQVVLRPAPEGWNKKAREIAKAMQGGKHFEEIINEEHFFSKIGKIFSFFSANDKEKTPPTPSTGLTPDEQEVLRAIEHKATRAGFSVNIRLLASAASQERAEQILAQMENAFVQFDYPDINTFVVAKREKVRRTALRYIFRLFDDDRSMLLCAEEVASIYHFPISTTQTPKIRWLKAGVAAPPPNMPSEGLVLGYNEYRGSKTVVRLSPSDRRRHLYTIGQTGVGKSNFMQELAKQDIHEGRGMCFIDPHGDAIEDLLESVPKECANDVIILDPSDIGRPIGLNMLEYEKPEEKTFVINEMIKIFDRLYDLSKTGGPIFEQYMRNAMLLIMEDPASGSTLMECPRVLADADFRKFKLDRCNNPIVKNFWIKEAEKAGGEAALANVVPYVTSKLTQFISNDYMRPIIAQQKSTINFRSAMDEQKILLVNLSKGKIGSMNSNLIGMIVIGKLLMAALARADVSERERKDFYLYIDEFQNVTTDSIAQILSEARKYRLNLTIAHQFIGQLSEDISKAVFGNVGSLAVFRVGAEDAQFLEKQFAPVFAGSDLISIDNYNAFVRLLINNESTKPFNMKAYPPTAGNPAMATYLKQLSRLRYGRDADLVAAEVESRLAQAGL